MRLTVPFAVLVLALLTLAAPAAAQYSDPTGTWNVEWSELDIFTFPELTSGTAVFDVVRLSSGNWGFVDRATGQTACMAVPTETRTSPSSAHAECSSFVGSITWYEAAGPTSLETNWFFMELTGMGHADSRRWIVGRRQAPAMAVSITTPAAGATVSGTTTISAEVTNATGSSNTFTLTVDGTTVATQTVSGVSASFAWNSTTVGNGTHTLTVAVRDGAGRVASASRQVTVSNATAALKLYITQPRSGDTVSGTNWVVLWLEGTTSTSNTYTLTVDGLQVAQTTTSSRGPVSIPWNTKLVSNGTRTLTATARDSDGKTGTASISIVVRN
jgi:Bacterial Ig domain